MITYVFRNNTIEPFFTCLGEVHFSGYDDLSYIDAEADRYIWFYQVPFKFEREKVVAEVKALGDRLGLLLSNIPAHKEFIVLTLEDMAPMRYVEDDWNVHEAVNRFNRHLVELSTQYPNVRVFDFADFTRRFPVEQLMDWRFYFISQMGVNPKLASQFSAWLEKKLCEVKMQRKKCLVLDLDNTLWGGILGEDGMDGIRIGGDYPGKAFLYFQAGLVELSRQGVILTVCSKNNEADVLEAWEKNPFIKLNRKHISAYRINWQNKADNIRELSEELNIGLDSMVFIDDNPTERELVKQMLPMVEVPDFPKQPYLLPPFLLSVIDTYFKVYTLTEEDRKKTEQYKANASRAQERQRFTDFTDYLRSLEMQLDITPFDTFNLPRVAQMMQKTNQFNLTTHRYTDADLRRFVAEDWRGYTLSVKDKFGDNGITGAILLKPNDDGYEIDSLLLSCRILGKGIEHAFLSAVLNLLHRQGTAKVTATYLPTERNVQTVDYYERAGFIVDSQEADGSKLYHIDLTKQQAIADYYHITIQ